MDWEVSGIVFWREKRWIDLKEYFGGRADLIVKVEILFWIFVDIDRSLSIDGRSRTIFAVIWYNKVSYLELYIMCI